MPHATRRRSATWIMGVTARRIVCWGTTQAQKAESNDDLMCTDSATRMKQPGASGLREQCNYTYKPRRNLLITHNDYGIGYKSYRTKHPGAAINRLGKAMIHVATHQYPSPSPQLWAMTEKRSHIICRERLKVPSTPVSKLHCRLALNAGRAGGKLLKVVGGQFQSSLRPKPTRPTVTLILTLTPTHKQALWGARGRPGWSRSSAACV